MPLAKLTATLLTEELPEIGRSSRPSSPWSSLSVLQTSPIRLRTLSGNYTSKIPVLVGNSLRSQSFPFYSDFGDELDNVEQDATLRFADPKPTLKELHADGHKINQGIDEEDSGLGDNAEVWDEYWTEAKECDRELINELNGSLDVLLIFVRIGFQSYDLVLINLVLGWSVLCCSSRTAHRVLQDAAARQPG
jgi:hypothetical protein